jgi:hypothetical protein
MRSSQILAALGLVVCLISAGCYGDIKEVWVSGSGRVPESLASVKGFSITPHEAQSIAEKEFGMRKTVQHIYADSRYYYIVDGLFGSSRSKAAKTGIRVDGKTGECERFKRP